MTTPRTRLVVGCMSGTSIDALDTALVRVRGTGLAMRGDVIRHASRALGDLGPRLRALAEQQGMSAGGIAALSRDFSLAHAAAVNDLVRAEGIGGADLVCAHGQTVFHAPPVSWQMLNPAVVAHETRTAVVCDLRAADLAEGGQGAPITPLADWVLLRHAAGAGSAPGECGGSGGGTARGGIGVCNLGGFCNVTLLPEGGAADGDGVYRRVRGFDACACNHVLDAVARRALGRAYDEDGRAALAGTIHGEAAERLSRVLSAQRGLRRSLGTGDEVGHWVEEWRERMSGGDLAASACEGVASAIVSAIEQGAGGSGPRKEGGTMGATGSGPGLVLLAGGGARNAALVRAIGRRSTARIATTGEFGVAIEAREAACMAVLGALCQDGVGITIPGVTGCAGPEGERSGPVAGVWAYPPRTTPLAAAGRGDEREGGVRTQGARA